MALVLKQCLRLALAAAVLVSSAPSRDGGNRDSGLQPFQYSLDRMGTIFRIVLYAPDSTRALGAAMAAFERVEELEQILSDYRDDSELNRLCRNAGSGPVAVSRELFFVIEQSLRISRLTGGAFDVTIGPVVRLWREARKSGGVPGTVELQKARERVGYRNVILNGQVRTVQLRVPGMQLDFGAIGKGYAADQALTVLNSHGIRSAMIDAGGDLRLGAAPPGKSGWKIVVRNPDPRAQAAYLLLHDVAVATSGDAFQFVEVSGRRYSHILDPASGMGLTDSATVTVVARDGATADALATAVSVMRTSEAMRVVDSMEGASAAVVRGTGSSARRTVSSRFPQLRFDGRARKENRPQ